MNILLAMIPAFLWGTTYAVTKYATPDWPPLLLGALRALPAGLLLLLLKPSLPTRSQWPSLLTLGAVNIALFFAFIFIMAVNLPAAIAGVGMVSVPVVALLYAWIVKGQRPARVQAFCAIALVVLAWLLFDPAYVTLNVLGVTALLGALLTIVIGSTLVQSLSVHIHWWVVLTWQLIIGGSILLLAAFIDGSLLNPEQYQVVFEPISALQYSALFWLIVPNTAIAYTLYVWLLGRMSVAEFSFGTIANPIAGIVCAVLLINEQYQDWQYLLMFMMIVFSVLPQMLKLKQFKQQKT
ncbi:EamA family transporter [uncultured Pseudoalteromonas sp.]|uniref:DMT family transporter n=1 Tax=uncultured Pseudoalteromonas sp. TaxID=114053 RepID=UPI000C41268F|nr:EamA family transporter [uncultured Pseudoalteromonas sp.]MBD58466.1 EamA family transporter [Pseudoalteromonas sp.]